jgi:hypothetical protein
MREPRNPFRLRRSESIDTETTFLNLFEPGILEVMPTERFWDTVHILRSAAGGGKTSLIRLFAPNTLLSLCANRTNDRIKELYQRLKDIGAVDDTGPKVLGVMLMCGPGYSMLHDLELDQARKDRLFFGLLNARVVLAVLRGALFLKRLEYPSDLDRIRINPPPDGSTISGLTFPCTGKALHDWAEKREAKLCSSLDSFGPLNVESLPGDESLLSLAVIQPKNLLIDGSPVADRVLLMMDDIHKLTGRQRSMLIKTVIDARSPVGVWIAERFEALSTQEMLSSGAHQGRDYEHATEIESYWREFPTRFEKLAMKVADRRVQAAPEREDIGTFKACLQDALDLPEWDDTFSTIIRGVSERIRQRVGSQQRFQDWIALRENAEGTLRERAISWRSLEILIERELGKRQKSLFQDESLDEEELHQRDDSSVNNAAELFLAKEFNLPYFYGPERIARLASLNIQQFLGLAGEVFEESTAALLIGKPTELSPRRQHALMKKAANAVWEEIPNRVRHGRDLRRLLENIGKFAHWYTYRPTAPNDPGVSGTAIRMSERASLVDDNYRKNKPDVCQFADLLASALAHNLLVAQLDYNCKKEKWMVLNLNRLLCVHFDLPLNYGLYKERPLATLCQWMSKPFVVPTNEDTLL